MDNDYSWSFISLIKNYYNIENYNKNEYVKHMITILDYSYDLL